MTSLEALSDRLAINDLMIRYAYAVDFGHYDWFDEIFTADAKIDYSATGGPTGTVADVKAYLPTAFRLFAGRQHLIANTIAEIDSDTASAKTMCHNPMTFRLKGGNTHTAFFGLWYIDDLVRVDGVWRITERRQQLSYMHNLPDADIVSRFDPSPE